MSTNLQHTSIRASAGTGKTYQLANRYLALLLLQGMGGGKISPERIVAMTFTRKGAGEFAERILHRLAAAAGDAAERMKLKSDLALLVNGDASRGIAGLAPGVTLSVDAEILQSALATMVDQFDRLALGTIDSFMARSVQTLAFELGLGGFEILEEAVAERDREELLGEVFRAVPPAGLGGFYQILKLATLKSPSSLRTELGRFVAAYHKLLQALEEAEGWGGSGFWPGGTPGSPGPEWKIQAAELAEQVAGQSFGHAGISNSLAKALNWIAGRIPGTAGAAAGWLDEGDRLAKLWRAWPEGDWTFDYQRKSRTVPASILNLLKPILSGWIAAECAALSHKTAAIHQIVSGYEKFYDRLSRSKGRLAFDDLPLLLDGRKGAPAPGPALELLAFRWFQQFDHWLLDEFQDTSRVQWGVLKPWLDEAIQDGSGTKSVFVVGDPKQSIYGWRDAEPRLFDELAVSYPGAFKEQVMAESWRSRPAVLELVNLVCDPLNNPALMDPDQLSSAARERWQYEPHFSAEKLKSEPGYAAVLLAPEAEAGEVASGDPEAEAAGELAEKLASQARVIMSVLDRVRPLERGLSCAILVRRNDSAEAVAQWLRAHGALQVMVEGEATLARQSPLVAALVDALRWLAVPANSLAAGHASATPLWEILRQPLKSAEAADAPPGAVWRHWRQRIADVGAPQVTHEWCVALASQQVEPYAQYCLRHVSQSARQAGPAVALPDWLAMLEQLAVRETAAAGSIHVMTIHKAKGLGFDVVFLPDLDSGGGGRDSILIRRDEEGCARGCLSYPPKWLQAWQPGLEDLCAAQKAGQELESLCVLYVALTRAKEATFVILNKAKPRRASAAREWILSAVAQPDTGELLVNPWGEGDLQWECGSQDFGAARKAVPEEPASLAAADKLRAPVARRKRRKPSEAGHELAASRTAGLFSGGGQEFGTAVHEVFEQIEWWQPGQSLAGGKDAVDLVRKCLAVPEIQALFTRESHWDEALRELPVEFMEKDTWWSGVIDRLVLRREADGKIRQAVLIDCKTDRVGDPGTLRERYSGQLMIYRRAISTALNIEADQVQTFLLGTHFPALLRL